jgi:hypothetical protein
MWSEDVENVVAFTTRQVVDGREPILAVFHGAEDGAWQFISAVGATMADLMIVSLRQVFDIDPSIVEVGRPSYWMGSVTTSAWPAVATAGERVKMASHRDRSRMVWPSPNASWHATTDGRRGG